MQAGARIVWGAVVGLTVIAAACLDWAYASRVTADWPRFAVDFTVFWTAARMPLDLIYDANAITQAQAWAVSDLTVLRPFPYPPSLLLYLQPLRAVPILPAYFAWAALSIVLYGLAAWKLLGRAWPLVLLSPAVAVATITGQVTLVVGAGLAAALIWLPARPLLAGAILGVLATIKPQVLLLAPLALWVGGHRRALAAAVIAGGGLGLASLALYGPAIWLRWPAALVEFQAIIDARDWIGITPKAMARLAGLEGWGQAVVMLAGAGLGAWLVISAFRRTEDPVERLLALTTGYFLVTPYALMYELALVQPAAVALMMRGRNLPSRVAGLVAFFAIVRPLATLLLALCRLPIWPSLRAAEPEPLRQAA